MLLRIGARKIPSLHGSFYSPEPPSRRPHAAPMIRPIPAPKATPIPMLFNTVPITMPTAVPNTNPITDVFAHPLDVVRWLLH